MEKKQYDLLVEILHRFSDTGILPHIVLIGSWCVPLYKQFIPEMKNAPAIKTRDVDFLIPLPSRIKDSINIPELLKDLGFIIDMSPAGFVKLDHPELIVEFLVPERGQGTDGPFPLPQIGMNAPALRFLNFLTSNFMTVVIDGVSVKIPNPVVFSLHKIIVSARRKNEEKSIKDKRMAIDILNLLIKNKKTNRVKEELNSIPQKWQIRIKSILEEYEENEIVKELF